MRAPPAASSRLQANKMGWYVHGMVGFDMQRAFAELHVPPRDTALRRAFAVGRRGDKSKLPRDATD